MPDARVDSAPAPVARTRGSSCGAEQACATEQLTCLPAPGGYCTSFCGVTGTACPDGACVETARAGELCLKRCTRDADCRVAEGYLCDPVWKACIVPNTVTIVPKTCPAAAAAARDPAFGPSRALSTAAAPGVYQFEPSTVLTNAGGLVTMYITRGGIAEPNVLGISRVSGTGVPTIDVRFASDRASHFDPWLTRDAKGTVYAVWLGFDGRSQNQQIGFAASKDGGVTWSTPTSVDAAGDCKDGESDCLDKPMIIVGPDPAKRGGEIIYVTYAAADGLRVRASRDGGATFGAAVTALEGIYGNLAVQADGRLHVVTLNGGPMGGFGATDHKVEHAMSADGGKTFTKAQTLSERDEVLPFFFSNPSVVVDSKRGWIYAAYTRGGRDAVWDLVVVASKDKGKTWNRTRIGDDPACAIHMVPNLALDPTTGTLHVAWYDNRGVTGRFAHATCGVGAATCTQAGAINDVPFAALSTVRHSAKWIGEYESLVIDDKRRVLHAVWSEPVDEQGKIVSRIFHATAKLPRK